MSIPQALPNASGDLFVLDEATILEGIEKSRLSSRKRIIFPIHRNQDDLVQRMVNFVQPGTYIAPHIHPRDHASESVFINRGAIGFILFDELGNVQSTTKLEQGGFLDIVPGVWHTMLALEPDTIMFEFKRGPYDDSDKHFASWAPQEGEPGTEELLAKYLTYFA